ncbi:hypothetical protein GYMLUDRAFT_59295 [Collybiopsis luxurians FD-317 M1]|uniref:MYND-type domain-containing protein n=1 Tax=Collybiopsis luxurians FD-317 M1 TaxID=944289 RepID=A0A0D0BYM6_9AGAR|nr:hypothetical protein GYMLUDRAFT_59295 [Collybiopsis luxurians FD-317 M1]
MRWPAPIHHSAVRVLVWFLQGLQECGLNASVDVFRKEASNVCSQIVGCSLFGVWSRSAWDFCSWCASSHDNFSSQAFLLSVTGLYFVRPLLKIQESEVLVDHMRTIWDHQLCFSSPFEARTGELLPSASIQSSAAFFSLFSSGGPDWTVKALDAGLLYLLTKTLYWLTPPTACTWQPAQITAISVKVQKALEPIMDTVLRNSIYPRVERQIQRNLKRVYSRNLEQSMPGGRLSTLWNELEKEIMDAGMFLIRTLCYEKSLEQMCSNKSCSYKCAHGDRSKFCGSCLAESYCCKECQVKDWRAGHKAICRETSVKKSTHPSATPDCTSIPIGAVKSTYFLFRVISTIKLDRSDEICRSISDQGLDSTKIVIEFDLNVLPWKVSMKAQSNTTMARFLHSLPDQQDTVIGIRYAANGGGSDYFVYPVHCRPLLDPNHTLEFKTSFGNERLRILYGVWFCIDVNLSASGAQKEENVLSILLSAHAELLVATASRSDPTNIQLVLKYDAFLNSLMSSLSIDTSINRVHFRLNDLNTIRCELSIQGKLAPMKALWMNLSFPF